MAAWDLLGGTVQLVFNSFLFKFKDAVEPSGILAGRAFSGALFVTAILYVIAALNPTRYRFILWLAVVEQLVAICGGVFHGARSDLSWGGLVLPIAVAMALLIMLLLHYPHALPKEMAAEEAASPESESELPPDEH
jgi:K+ transporter